MWQRTDDCLWPTASKELSPSVHHSWGHKASQQSYEWAWKWILTQLSLEMSAASAMPLLQLWTDPKAENSTKLFPEPSNTNSEVMHIINHDLLSNLLCHNTKYSFLYKKDVLVNVTGEYFSTVTYSVLVHLSLCSSGTQKRFITQLRVKWTSNQKPASVFSWRLASIRETTKPTCIFPRTVFLVLLCQNTF